MAHGFCSPREDWTDYADIAASDESEDTMRATYTLQPAKTYTAGELEAIALAFVSAGTETNVSTRNAWNAGRNLAGNHDATIRHHDSFHPDPRDIDKAACILSPILAGYEDGATIDAGYNHVPLEREYVVGGKIPGVAYDDTEPLRDLAGMLHRFIVASPIFAGTPKLFGVWRDGGLVYFDYVTLHDEFGDAAKVARERNQRAVYDALTKTSYTLHPR